MPTTTRILALQRLSEAFEDWWSNATSAQGAASGASLIDDSLAELSDDDDFCLGWYVRITSGSANFSTRRVASYTASTKTIVPTSNFPARIESTVTYELHRINPTTKHNALNAAAAESFPDLHVRLRDETIVIDDLLSNPSFETAGAGPPTFLSWPETGSPTVTAETSIVFHGSQSAKVVAGGSVGSLRQAPTLNVSRLIGKRMTFKRWVWTAAGSQARVGMNFGGADATSYGDYHAGDSTWRLLTVSATVPTDATQVDCYCEVTALDTAYFDGGDGAGLFSVPVYKYTVPTTMLRGPHFISQQDTPGVHSDHSTFSRIPDYTAPISRRLLRLEGMGLLSQPSTDSGTYEVGNPQLRLLLLYAARLVYRTGMQGGSQQEREYLARLKADWDADIEKLSEKRRGIVMRPLSAEIPRGSWRTEEDADGKYIIFEQNRGGSSSAAAA